MERSNRRLMNVIPNTHDNLQAQHNQLGICCLLSLVSLIFEIQIDRSEPCCRGDNNSTVNFRMLHQQTQ